MAPYPGLAGATRPVANNQAFHLQKGDSMYVLGQLAAGATQLPIAENNVDFEAAPAAATGKSLSVCIMQDGGESNTVPTVLVEIRYPSAPGGGEQIEIQEADTDADAFYITPAAAAYTVTSFNATTFIARVDLFTTGGKFMLVKRTKGANAVGCIVKITRLA